MLKQYIKQAFQMLKENRLVSTISITGTGHFHYDDHDGRAGTTSTGG